MAADISQGFKVEDILWFLKAITDLIVSGGKAEPVIRYIINAETISSG
jgi:hypothetical protein